MCGFIQLGNNHILTVTIGEHWGLVLVTVSNNVIPCAKNKS